MIVPCMKCEKKGCGSYHDDCEKYQEYKAYRNSMSEAKQKKDKTYHTFIPPKTYKTRCGNTQFKCHKVRSNKNEQNE